MKLFTIYKLRKELEQSVYLELQFCYIIKFNVSCRTDYTAVVKRFITEYVVVMVNKPSVYG